MFLILTGKTAAGKDTIKQALLNKYPNLKPVLTTTSREPRKAEINGRDYHFVTREIFKKQVDDNHFAEWVEYGGNLYGTYKSELEKALESDLIWKIDPSRAGEARDFINRSFPVEVAKKLTDKLVVIYVNTDDNVVLERLRARGLPEAEIQSRMADDDKIWAKNQSNYDYIVENIPGSLNLTLDKINQILENHHF